MESVMEIGIYANTHGNSYRDDTNMYLRNSPLEETQPLKVACAAEAAGFHSIWYPDHVSMPIGSESFHTANQSGQRAYQPYHNMLDAAVVMGAVAQQTNRIRLGTSVLISPYRHPLSDARQFMTVDQLSNGRLMLGVGAGWMKEEFDSVGIDHAERNGRLTECIEIYKRSWSQTEVSFPGEFYNFKDISMDPKPVQKPTPPILLGANTPAGARRSARYCDGLYSLFLDSHVEFDRFNPLQEIIKKERESMGLGVENFLMIGAATAKITNKDHEESTNKPRRNCGGTAEQILEDLSKYADAGYSMIICMLQCETDSVSEQMEQIHRFGEEIIPTARTFAPKGDWKKVD
tara:strand:- start:833 stop:1873 length:1041 start_codon:yes stop_codon:yes gene_type:complete